MESKADAMRELLQNKDNIEHEIAELMSVLESQGGVGMHGLLVDEEQYPRSDIDVYTVRHARHQVSRLQNDHKALMKQIEENLHEIHASAKVRREAARSTEEPTEEPMEIGSTNGAVSRAFAKVDRVELGSPAAVAGLEVGDLLIQFGSINKESFRTLQDIGKVVQHSVGKTTAVEVLRGALSLRLSLEPRTWGGRGLLGCNIIPVPES